MLFTSLWVLDDARRIGVRKGQMSGLLDMGPSGWFVGCLFLWPAVLPAYLALRGKYRYINGRQSKGAATRSVVMCMLVCL